MSEFKSLPESISHKKLNSLFNAAQKETFKFEEDGNECLEESSAFKKLIVNWASLSEELLEALSKKHKIIVEGKTSKSVMALGALEAHLNMALQLSLIHI